MRGLNEAVMSNLGQEGELSLYGLEDDWEYYGANTTAGGNACMCLCVCIYVYVCVLYKGRN